MAIPLHKRSRRPSESRLSVPRGLSVALGALRQLRTRRAAAAEAPGDVDECSCGPALAGRPGRAYNEEAFRYFLEIERKRSDVSGRPFLLLLVSLRKERGLSVRIDPVIADKLFSSLALCLRETDFVGWYRRERVAGAVLTQRAEIAPADASPRVAERVERELRAQLPSDVGDRVQIGVYRLPPTRQR